MSSSRTESLSLIPFIMPSVTHKPAESLLPLFIRQLSLILTNSLTHYSPDFLNSATHNTFSHFLQMAACMRGAFSLALAGKFNSLTCASLPGQHTCSLDMPTRAPGKKCRWRVTRAQLTRGCPVHVNQGMKTRRTSPASSSAGQNASHRCHQICPDQPASQPTHGLLFSFFFLIPPVSSCTSVRLLIFPFLSSLRYLLHLCYSPHSCFPLSH